MEPLTARGGAALAGRGRGRGERPRCQTSSAIVADPYTFKVELKEGAIDALTTRERIRSTGPTVRVRRPD